MAKRREYNRQWYLANQEKAKARARENRLNNLERERERDRVRHALNGPRGKLAILRREIRDELWAEQGGCCYLCGDQLARKEDAHLDHDHRCCPYHKLCRFCVRGLSCSHCNLAIGNAGDDPDRLELIARNLRIKLAEMDERLASKPQQLELA